MPKIKSAKKALRQSVRHHQKNLAKKVAYKNAFKGMKKLVETNKDEAEKMLPIVYKKIDKAAKNGVIKPNKAARLKSKAAKLLATATK